MSNREQPSRNYQEILRYTRTTPGVKIVYVDMRGGPASDAIRDLVARKVGRTLVAHGCKGIWDKGIIPTGNGRAVFELKITIQEAVGVSHADQESVVRERETSETSRGN
jgi:hypothetical protein